MPLLFAAAGFGLLFLAHTAPFPFLLEALAGDRSRWAMPVEHGATIYLTFDDGPNPEATPALLDVLDREGARGTFFLIDRHVTEETAPIVRRMFDEGHGVALHSHTRALMTYTPEALARTLEAAADKIERLVGRRPCRIFRPHAGWRGGQMYTGLTRSDYVLVGWGWMLWDWSWPRPRTGERTAARIISRASAGDIVVIHDGHHIDPRADRRYAVDAIVRIIPALRDKGFQFGTVCEAMGR